MAVSYLRVWMMVLKFAWFAVVAFLLSIPSVNGQFQRAGHWIDRVLGVVMVGLGIKSRFKLIKHFLCSYQKPSAFTDGFIYLRFCEKH